MLIRTGFDLRFRCEKPVPAMAMLNIRPERERDLKTPQRLLTKPELPLRRFTDQFGNVCTRLVLPAGETRLYTDFVIECEDTHEPVIPDAAKHPVDDLPDEALPFLLGSRYCEVGKLSDVAWKAIEGYETGWQMVQALVDLAHERVTFGYEHADADRTAHGAYAGQYGVCRDFAHLGITLCREVNIPARYCTGYLGDIGIDPIDAPMDFSAWFEAYIGGQWHTFDARHNTPRIARIVMARGRDAVDAALTTTFGKADLAHFHVHTDEVESTDLSRPPADTALEQWAGKFAN